MNACVGWGGGDVHTPEAAFDRDKMLDELSCRFAMYDGIVAADPPRGKGRRDEG